MSKMKNAIEDSVNSLVPSPDQDMSSIISAKNDMKNLELKEKNILRKKTKKTDISKLVNTKKINLPIGKIFSMGKNLKENTLFELTKQDLDSIIHENKKEVEEKWSKKYKESIDCNNPKGFSQKAHCQGRKKKETKEEVLKGGKADKRTLKDIAKKHDKKGYYHIDNVLESLKKQLNKGIKIEMEHTNNKQKAKEIAMDHLFEDPKYYDKLSKIETKEATGSGSAGGFVAPIGFDPKSDFVKRSFKETPKKVEAKEATGSASSGSYVTPAAWAKSTSKKDWRGKSKTQIPGGKFVQVKKKCKKFPYCNQGDINALKLTNESELNRVIKNVSEKQGISENLVKQILFHELNKIK